MFLKIEDVAGVKLVTDENNYASHGEVRNSLEGAFVQGSQGWGVSHDNAVLLTVARDLKEVLMLANVADENHRLLKGAQLELGRVKKQRSVALAERASLEGKVIEQAVQIKSLQELVDDVTQQRDETRQRAERYITEIADLTAANNSTILESKEDVL